MALGTATAYPSAVVMVGALARQANTTSTRPLGRIQMANTSGAAVGPVVGGLLVSLVGWEALFLINVPLALAALLIVRRFAPADQSREQGSVAVLLRDSDIPGILAFTGGMVLLHPERVAARKAAAKRRPAAKRGTRAKAGARR